MSDTGLYSGLYEQTRQYAQLVDDVLVSLKEGRSAPDDAARQTLVQLLFNLANGRSDDLGTRLLVLALRDKQGVDSAAWAQAGQALQSPKVVDSAIELLEYLARALEQEQAGALARMRGWSR